MKKKLAVIALFLVMLLALSGCACKHEWVEATCTVAKTCSKCQEVEGEPLGHTWVDADCVTPKTCSVCALTEGEALGHTWVDADCVTPKTCSVCAATEGEALGHTWVDADCVTPKTCSVCAATEGEALGHTWVDADCVTPKTCSVCAVTEGEALGHTWVDATCEAPKTCSVCALTEGEALGHTLSDWAVDGAALVKKCDNCASVAETKEIQVASDVEMKPFKHEESGIVFLVPANWETENLPEALKNSTASIYTCYDPATNRAFVIEYIDLGSPLDIESGAEILRANYPDLQILDGKLGQKIITVKSENMIEGAFFNGNYMFSIIYAHADLGSIAGDDALETISLDTYMNIFAE